VATSAFYCTLNTHYRIVLYRYATRDLESPLRMIQRVRRQNTNETWTVMQRRVYRKQIQIHG